MLCIANAQADALLAQRRRVDECAATPFVFRVPSASPQHRDSAGRVAVSLVSALRSALRCAAVRVLSALTLRRFQPCSVSSPSRQPMLHWAALPCSQYLPPPSILNCTAHLGLLRRHTPALDCASPSSALDCPPPSNVLVDSGPLNASLVRDRAQPPSFPGHCMPAPSRTCQTCPPCCPINFAHTTPHTLARRLSSAHPDCL